jgi:hypothetical protein
MNTLSSTDLFLKVIDIICHGENLSDQLENYVADFKLKIQDKISVLVRQCRIVIWDDSRLVNRLVIICCVLIKDTDSTSSHDIASTQGVVVSVRQFVSLSRFRSNI